MDYKTFLHILRDDTIMKAEKEKRQLSNLREKVVDFFFTRASENEFLDIEGIPEEYVRKIREEIHSTGWKTELSYGDTGLFIFSNIKPKSCH